MFNEQKYSQRARTLTNLENYNPAIAHAMARLGLFSYQELWDRVVPYLTKYPEFFADINYHSLNPYVFKDKSFPRAMEDGYPPVCYAVAFALNTHVDELFGHAVLAQAQEPLNIKEYNALDVWGDSYQDRRIGPLAEILRRDFANIVERVVASLSNESQQYCLRRYFGLAGQGPATQQEIADELGISYQVVGQKIQRGIRALKHDSRAKELRPFLNDFYTP